MSDVLKTTSVNGAKRLVVPPLEDEHVLLRAVMPEDQMFLQLVATSTDLAPRWRYRGATPGPEQWAHAGWGPTLAQFVVVGREGERPVGLVEVLGPSFQDGHARLDAAKFDGEDRSPLMRRGIALFVDYVFACWPFEKLYVELPEHAYPRVARWEGEVFEVEARLREHTWLGGRRWDHLILAIYREAWRARAREAPAA